MNRSINITKTSWLHISDLHVFPEADTNLMLDDYKELAKIISPEFLVISGDFRHQRLMPDFSLAKQYLEKLIRIFNINKKDIFLVPGNHDANEYDGRADNISEICNCSAKENYNVYSKYSLREGFTEYNSFVFDFYNESGISDSRLTDPSGVHCITWNDMINVFLINTALISDGKKHDQILDINTLTKFEINNELPSIMIGHHGIESLYSCYSKRLIGVIDRKNISAYLHGDSHRYSNNPVIKISTPNRTIPSITCAKSAPQSGDLYSDIGVVYYEWKNDDNTYIQAYRWSTNGFVEDFSYYYSVNKRYSFPMIYNKEKVLIESENLYKQIKEIMNDHSSFMEGKWLDNAEQLWKISCHQGIGRCLLIFYYEQVAKNRIGAHQRVQEVYCQLETLSNTDSNTRALLNAIKEELFSGCQGG